MTDPNTIRGWVAGGVYRDGAARADLLALCGEVDALRAELEDAMNVCARCSADLGVPPVPAPKLTEEERTVVDVVGFRHAEYGASPDFVQTAVLLAIINRLVPVEEP